MFTPTYNRAHTLHRVYNSLVQQSVPCFEWLIVDDGSIDNTERLVARWASEAQFPIRYLRQDNRGKHMATNLGVREARGVFFLELDSDDACVPYALERFAFHWLAIPEADRSSFTGVTALCQDQHGRIVGDRFPSDVLDSNSLEVRYRYKVRGEKWGFQRTEVLRQFPFPLTEEPIYVPEGVVWSRIARKYRTRFVNEPLRIYWTDNDAGSERLTAKRSLGRANQGYVIWHRSVLDTETDWFRRAPKEFLRSAFHYSRFSFHSRVGVREQQRTVPNLLGKTLWLTMLPMGWGAYIADVAKSGKFAKYIAILRAQQRPLKFLISRLLMRSRLSQLIVIRRQDYAVRFYPSSVNAALWLDPSQRSSDEDIFRLYLRDGDVVVDVGANVGTLSLTASLAVGPTGRVYAVEPHPRIVRYLRGNIEQNNARNVTIHHVALGDKDGTAWLSDRRNDDQNVIVDGVGRIGVRMLPLDALPVTEGPIALLKVDVEGFEKFVIDGGRETLRRVGFVYFESWNRHFSRFGYSSEELFATLSLHGFTLFRLEGRGTLAPLPEGYTSRELENLFAVRDVQEFLQRTGLSLDTPIR